MSLTVETSHDAWSRAMAARNEVDLTWATDGLADGWALPADALALLMALVPELQPRHIIELGSGLSTRAFARASAALNQPCAISSIDHDPVFSERAAERLADDGLEGTVRFQVAPLVARIVHGRGPMLPTYLLDPTQLASPLPADLVLIDGPPSFLGGRAGTLLQVLDLCRTGTTVLLDDANRDQERAALDLWNARLGDMIEVELFPEFDRGLARLLVGDTALLAR